MKKNKFIIHSTTNIKNKLGDIEKLIDYKSKYFSGFQELYISSIKNNHVKAWKKHLFMISNLFIIKGRIKFVFITGKNSYEEFIIADKDKKFITIYPRTVFGFQGLASSESKLLNFSNLIHEDNESIKYPLDKFKYDW